MHVDKVVHTMQDAQYFINRSHNTPITNAIAPPISTISSAIFSKSPANAPITAAVSCNRSTRGFSAVGPLLLVAVSVSVVLQNSFGSYADVSTPKALIRE